MPYIDQKVGNLVTGFHAGMRVGENLDGTKKKSQAIKGEQLATRVNTFITSNKKSLTETHLNMLLSAIQTRKQGLVDRKNNLGFFGKLFVGKKIQKAIDNLSNTEKKVAEAQTKLLPASTKKHAKAKAEEKAPKTQRAAQSALAAALTGKPSAVEKKEEALPAPEEALPSAPITGGPPPPPMMGLKPKPKLFAGEPKAPDIKKMTVGKDPQGEAKQIRTYVGKLEKALEPIKKTLDKHTKMKEDLSSRTKNLDSFQAQKKAQEKKSNRLEAAQTSNTSTTIEKKGALVILPDALWNEQKKLRGKLTEQEQKYYDRNAPLLECQKLSYQIKQTETALNTLEGKISKEKEQVKQLSSSVKEIEKQKSGDIAFADYKQLYGNKMSAMRTWIRAAERREKGETKKKVTTLDRAQTRLEEVRAANPILGEMLDAYQQMPIGDRAQLTRSPKQFSQEAV